MSTKIFEATHHRVNHGARPEVPAVVRDSAAAPLGGWLAQVICLACGAEDQRWWLSACPRCFTRAVVIEAVGRPRPSDKSCAQRLSAEGVVSSP